MTLKHNCKRKYGYHSLLGCIALTFILFLNGCSSLHSKKSSMSLFDVDPSTIPDAEPKAEKLTKYGNKSTYRVRGKKYHVMKSAKNYEERGLASWYGTEFHKHRTSSGERYNMLSMTAAHKTLPLPTYVQVTNEKNGRKVIVKINDRGPFSPNRLIDLSYVAAKKLGMIGNGTTHVHVQAIDPDEAYQHPELLAQRKAKQPIQTAQSNRRHSVYLHVGAYKNKTFAEKSRKKLKLMVSSPVNVSHLSKTSQKPYYVKIGPIKDVATANSIKKKLKAIGLTSKSIKV